MVKSRIEDSAIIAQKLENLIETSIDPNGIEPV